MKLFALRETREAKQFALDGGQALHVWGPEDGTPWMAGGPNVFKRAASQGKPWGHLMDQDAERLEKTVRRLGVRVVKIHHPGTVLQHVDLCGRPLDRAIEEAKKEEPTV